MKRLLLLALLLLGSCTYNTTLQPFPQTNSIQNNTTVTVTCGNTATTNVTTIVSNLTTYTYTWITNTAYMTNTWTLTNYVNVYLTNVTFITNVTNRI